ncbi:MAG: SDR family oxidoreductase [Phycisphaerales bacterium JB043]
MTETGTEPSRPRALVTGGAWRVGAAICRRLALAGCDVTLTCNSRTREAEALVDELTSLGTRATAHRLALEDEAALSAFTRSFGDTHDRLDVLVHNASTYFPCPLEDVTPERALHDYRVNALAPLLLTRDLAPLLRSSTLDGGGSVIALLDIHILDRPRARFAPYSMSKSALHEMVRTLARELAPDVRVNAVAPGIVALPHEEFVEDAPWVDDYRARVPLQRLGTPDEAAEAVRWLALDATYTTGQVIRVDGGRWLA